MPIVIVLLLLICLLLWEVRQRLLEIADLLASVYLFGNKDSEEKKIRTDAETVGDFLALSKTPLDAHWINARAQLRGWRMEMQSGYKSRVTDIWEKKKAK